MNNPNVNQTNNNTGARNTANTDGTLPSASVRSDRSYAPPQLSSQNQREFPEVSEIHSQRSSTFDSTSTRNLQNTRHFLEQDTITNTHQMSMNSSTRLDRTLVIDNPSVLIHNRPYLITIRTDHWPGLSVPANSYAALNFPVEVGSRHEIYNYSVIVNESTGVTGNYLNPRNSFPNVPISEVRQQTNFTNSPVYFLPLGTMYTAAPVTPVHLVAEGSLLLSTSGQEWGYLMVDDIAPPSVSTPREGLSIYRVQQRDPHGSRFQYERSPNSGVQQIRSAYQGIQYGAASYHRVREGIVGHHGRVQQGGYSYSGMRYGGGLYDEGRIPTRVHHGGPCSRIEQGGTSNLGTQYGGPSCPRFQQRGISNLGIQYGRPSPIVQQGGISYPWIQYDGALYGGQQGSRLHTGVPHGGLPFTEPQYSELARTTVQQERSSNTGILNERTPNPIVQEGVSTTGTHHEAPICNRVQRGGTSNPGIQYGGASYNDRQQRRLFSTGVQHEGLPSYRGIQEGVSPTRSNHGTLFGNPVQRGETSNTEIQYGRPCPIYQQGGISYPGIQYDGTYFRGQEERRFPTGVPHGGQEDATYSGVQHRGLSYSAVQQGGLSSPRALEGHSYPRIQQGRSSNTGVQQAAISRPAEQRGGLSNFNIQPGEFSYTGVEHGQLPNPAEQHGLFYYPRALEGTSYPRIQQGTPSNTGIQQVATSRPAEQRGGLSYSEVEHERLPNPAEQQGGFPYSEALEGPSSPRIQPGRLSDTGVQVAISRPAERGRFSNSIIQLRGLSYSEVEHGRLPNLAEQGGFPYSIDLGGLSFPRALEELSYPRALEGPSYPRIQHERSSNTGVQVAISRPAEQREGLSNSNIQLGGLSCSEVEHGRLPNSVEQQGGFPYSRALGGLCYPRIQGRPNPETQQAALSHPAEQQGGLSNFCVQQGESAYSGVEQGRLPDPVVQHGDAQQFDIVAEAAFDIIPVRETDSTSPSAITIVLEDDKEP